MSEVSTKDVWDKLSVLAGPIAGLFVSIAVAYLGYAHNQATMDSQTRIRYVEVALSVLRAKPEAETAALRVWAADLLSQTSPVPLPAEARAQLKTQKIPINYSEYSHVGGDIYDPSSAKQGRSPSVAKPLEK